MWLYIVINIIFSIILITLFHYLWNYFKDNYSTKKTKNIVDYQTQKYKEIINNIQNNQKPPQTYISQEEKQNMIDELKSLLIEETVSQPHDSSDNSTQFDKI